MATDTSFGGKELQKDSQRATSAEELVDETRAVASDNAKASLRGIDADGDPMSKFLCTFSGKYGDILWSLPTAKFIAEKIAGESVDFAVMPYYANLLPLLVEQSYIQHAFVIENWLRTHSNHGDQPWQPPVQEIGNGAVQVSIGKDEQGVENWWLYNRAWHLTYRGHPGISAPAMPLLDFVAYQQGISFVGWQPCPFLSVSDDVREKAFEIPDVKEGVEEQRLVAYAFNEQYDKRKKAFFELLWAQPFSPRLIFFNVATVGWKEAAWIIKNSICYLGDRSASWVVANGLGKTCITYEPHPSRHKSGHLGKVFGNPYGQEIALPLELPDHIAAQSAAALLQQIQKERCVATA